MQSLEQEVQKLHQKMGIDEKFFQLLKDMGYKKSPDEPGAYIKTLPYGILRVEIPHIEYDMGDYITKSCEFAHMRTDVPLHEEEYVDLCSTDNIQILSKFIETHQKQYSYMYHSSALRIICDIQLDTQKLACMTTQEVNQELQKIVSSSELFESQHILVQHMDDGWCVDIGGEQK